MPTPHNSANPGDFAKTVLMPGDPLRAKFIAQTFLEDARLVNNVRGIQGYTGTYKGVPVSVMASGMGMPSMGIYSYELFHDYGVENILRIGSAGAISRKLKLRDVVAGQASCTDSNFAHQYGLPGQIAPIADFKLLETAVAAAREIGVEMPVGSLLSSDVFYDASGSTMKWAEMGVLAVEMESAALYMTAAKLGKRALAICSISDSIVTGEALDADERQTSFTTMSVDGVEAAHRNQNCVAAAQLRQLRGAELVAQVPQVGHGEPLGGEGAHNVAPPQGAALVVVEGLYLLDGEGIRLALGQADVFGAAVVEMVVTAIDGVRLRRHVGQPLDLAVGVQQGAEAAALQHKAGVAHPGDGHNGNPPCRFFIVPPSSRRFPGQSSSWW